MCHKNLKLQSNIEDIVECTDAEHDSGHSKEHGEKSRIIDGEILGGNRRGNVRLGG